MSEKIKKVKVMNKSGFDKSHRNLSTTKVGTLTPVLVDELIPNTTIHLKDVVSASLPPLASDTFMSCDLELNAFFVPSRLCYKGFERWVTGQKISNNVYAANITMYVDKSRADYFKPGTLSDYLGAKFTKADLSAWTTTYSADTFTINPYPYIAYHRIYDDWYRNPLIQQPIFREPVHQGTSTYVNTLPYEMFTSTGSDATTSINTPSFSDGTLLFDLRQRNFGSDYFTIATPQAQAGPDVTVSTTGNSFTISQLRQQNSLQQFLERNNIAGPRYQDWLKAQYGADLNDGVAQRCLYLGSSRINVYSKGVNSTSSVIDPGVTNPLQNPFISVGTQYGQAVCNGNGTLVDSFTAQEHGYLMVIASLVPRVTYGTGINRMLRHYTKSGSRADMANPLLQNVGQQPIYVGELNGVDAIHQPNSVFGYSDRYSEYMDMNDEIHGLLRDGGSLESFALQRNFLNGQAQINSNFLEIPTTYLDQVAAVDGEISQYGCWMDLYFDYKVSMPLAKYCIPSLQDPAAEHGHEVTVKPGGSRID